MSDHDEKTTPADGSASSPAAESPFYVVAIGASAGGLPALEELFTDIASDVHAAFVVIQHLSPDFESKMDELLSRRTDLPIMAVADGMPVEPGKIYLPPASSDMFIRGGRLFLTERDRDHVFRLPIDHFFRSMAQDVGRRAIGVVLSGTGSDGSRGISEIHEAGADASRLSDIVEQEVSARAEAADIDFVVDLSDSPIPVLADRARLKQVQANLLTNAFKYTPEGGRVRLTVGLDDGEALIRVEDDGEGIPPHLLDQIFDPFVQGEKPARGNDETSLGLGLALVDSVVRAHGGEVSATSAGRGEGASFDVRLPMQSVVEIAPEQGFLAEESDVSEGQHRVLIVEDQDDNREILELALRSYGLEVFAVPCGEAALSELESGDYTVGLVDIGLPDMSGLDVARTARANGGADMLLFAVTGHGSQKDREAIMEAGFDLHIVKPVDVGRLVDAISDHSR